MLFEQADKIMDTLPIDNPDYEIFEKLITKSRSDIKDLTSVGKTNKKANILIDRITTSMELILNSLGIEV